MNGQTLSEPFTSPGFIKMNLLYYELVSAPHPSLHLCLKRVQALGSATLCLCVCGLTQGHLSPCDACTPPLGNGYACCTPPLGITVHYISTDTQ